MTWDSSSSAWIPLPGYIQRQHENHTKPFINTIGLPISSSRLPDQIGTSAVCLRSVNTDQYFLLTARHVVVPADATTSSSTSSNAIRLFDTASYKEHMEELDEQVVFLERYNARFESDSIRQYYETELAEMKLLKDKIERDIGDSEERYLGDVFASSPIEERRDGLPATPINDWALIELPRESHDMWASHNRISFRGDKEKELSRSNPDALPLLPELVKSVHRISTIISKSALESSAIAVFKIGATTGRTNRLTLGQTNAYPSYSRTRSPGWSKRSAIIALPHDFGYRSRSPAPDLERVWLVGMDRCVG